MRVLGSRRGTGENASCLLEVKPGGGTIVPTERSHRRTLGDTTFPTEFHSRSSKARKSFEKVPSTWRASS